MSEQPLKAAVLGGPPHAQALPPGTLPGSHGDDTRRNPKAFCRGEGEREGIMKYRSEPSPKHSLTLWGGKDFVRANF